MPLQLTGISSMATRQLLADLGTLSLAHTGIAMQMTSVGGVDAARRVQAGELFDMVVLASDAIDRLMAGGHLLAGSRVDLVSSGVAMAVPAGRPVPQVHSEEELKALVSSVSRLSYSSGPSGVALARLFERWGLSDAIAAKVVTPPPGVPVASLVARGEVDLGFQQTSEMLHVPGMTLLGPLPAAVQIVTIFSGAVSASSCQPQAVRSLLAFWASAACDAAKREQGMDPA